MFIALGVSLKYAILPAVVDTLVMSQEAAINLNIYFFGFINIFIYFPLKAFHYLVGVGGDK